MIVVSNVSCNINENNEIAFEKAIKSVKISKSNVLNCVVLKKSIDARHKNNIKFIFTIGIQTNLNEEKFVKCSKNIIYRKKTEASIECIKGHKKIEHSPIIVGFGPAGMFAGLILAQNGYKPIIIERGEDVDSRVKSVENFWKTGKLNTESNVQFGEGGAGTFSDGKLTTRINDPLCEYVLNQFVKFGAPEDILYKAKPHVGTDNLRNIVKNIKKEIIDLGGQVINNAKLTDICFNDSINKIYINNQPYPCSVLIIAIGHSARDTFQMLFSKNIAVECKPFSVGVRIEHLQKELNYALYGEYAEHPAISQGEYQLSLRKNDRAVYTFCMCPGGTVVPSSSEEGGVVTNGMSEYARNKENANSALVVSVSPSDFGNNPINAINFQRNLEKKAFNLSKNYSAPAQTVDCFLKNKIGLNVTKVKPSYSLGVKACNFNDIFPDYISTMMRDGLNDFNRKISGFNANYAVLTGVETRTSSPIRILRNDNKESISVKGLYPCGEGAGYAGGIMSAAVDGIKTAIAIMNEYKPK